MKVMTGLPGGVFLVNDGMPTQVTSGLNPSRHSFDSIGIIDGVTRTTTCVAVTVG